MVLQNFSITYPPIHPGTPRTDIKFYDEDPELFSVYHPGEEGSFRRLFVTDTKVASLPQLQTFLSAFHDGKAGNDQLIVLPAGEKFKTIESVLSILKTALDENFSRKDTFIGIGGGVICDMTAFAASVFKRGARVEFVPTTLLAMVDAAIGGKSGCDFENYKNMIGAFYPATKLHIFPQFVLSLDESQYRSGLAEAVKTALLYADELFTDFETHSEEIRQRDRLYIDNIIRTCARAKANVVEKDFTEQNVRMQLNFGHTFGHALETTVGLGIVTHGDAVAWGISRALELSVNKGFCRKEYRDRVCSTLAKYGWETTPMHSAFSEANAAQKLIDAMKKDKKNTGNKIRVILQEGLTRTIITEVEDSDIFAVLH